MSSNMLAGERRWASARRGGMTVLGKVAVPKPLNLPSQRLENHGLDPNVEIVPKGTLSWGSRPSSSGSNAWVSSSSPNADGGTVSPNHLSGRPSSGGSGTRPSTAGSDRTQEPVGNAWGSNSRPSSASGTLSSSQTSSTTLRPRSAENRPNSSQLSRFAEPGFKSSVAWGPSGTAERLGVKPFKDDGFSLSSGDFPTLGSEKDNSAKNIETGENGRPSSASGRLAHIHEDTKLQSDTRHGAVNTWRPDGTRSAEDDIHPGMEKWSGEHHQYINANGPQHFDAWHGPPANGPAGVWYGGRPRGPAFGGPVPPGGFPMEPFPYYHPQMPPPPLAGSQPVPHRGPGPRGSHPKNGDFYRPKVHDNYARPGMPFRPGFYPGPPGPMGFEGFYGPPPMGYCNNERDIPYMGMPSGPPAYNGYSAPRPDIVDSHARLGGHPVGKAPGQMDPDHLENTQVTNRVPLKKRNEYDEQRGDGENQKRIMQSNVSYLGKNRAPIISSRKNEWGAEVDAEDATVSKGALANEISSHSFDYQTHSSDNVKMKSFEGTGNAEDICRNDSEEASSFPSEMLPHAGGKELSKPAAAKNSVLMHKIDGLNAKVRVLDGRNDGSNAYYMDEERNRSRMVDLKSNYYTSEVGNTPAHFETTQVSKDYISRPNEVIGPATDKPIQSMTIVSRRSTHGGQGRIDYRSKGKFSQDADGWNRKPPPNTESSSAVIVSKSESSPLSNDLDPDTGVEASESSLINSTGRLEGDSDETCDSTDNQRAKMRELAKQRAMQLQKEEEERNRDMKAKAFAKLEELNRRTSVVDAANLTTDQALAAEDIQRKQELPAAGESALNLVSNPDATAVDYANWAGENTNIASLPVPEDAHDDNSQKETSRYNDGGFPRHKRTSYKQRHNNSMPKSLNEKSVSSIASDVQKDHSPVVTGDVTLLDTSCDNKPKESYVPITSGPMAELQSGQQRKKSSRAGKNKNKVAETITNLALPPVLSDPIPRKDSVETDGSKKSNMDAPVLNTVENNNGAQGHDVGSSLHGEESHGNRASHQWKSNASRKLPRNQQSNRFSGKTHGSDAVVWAPVPTQNKAKAPVDASQNSVQESSLDVSQNAIYESANHTKGDSTAQNSSRGKRAEMERYVPKPVAKELAQQGTVPPISSSTKSSISNEGPRREQSGSAGVTSHPVNSLTSHIGSSAENVGNLNKLKTDHGIWKQQGSIDMSHTTTLQFGDIPASETIQFLKSEIYATNAEAKSSGSVSSSGGDNKLSNPTSAAVTKYPSGRDHGATGRGKWHASKGSHRSTGNNLDPDNGSSSEFDGGLVQSAAPVVSQTERPVVPKENRTSPQWQPKSQSNTGNNHKGNRPGPEAETVETSRTLKKDHPHRKVQASSHYDSEPANVIQPQQGRTGNTAKSVVGHNQEIDREKKPAPANQRPYSPNPDTTDPNADDPTERHIPLGSRRNARQNPRFSRGPEPRGDWSGGGHQENRPHNPPSYRDRHRQNVHYEYQPVGQPMERGTGDNMENRHHRGRGQNHPKRGGNYYRRQTSGGGPVRADSQE